MIEALIFESDLHFPDYQKYLQSHPQYNHIHSNQSCYIGPTLGSYKHGFGYILDTTTCDIYQGHFHKNQKSGKGTMFYNLGDSTEIYQGQWSNDKKHGVGHIKDQKQNEIMSGIFANGQLKQGVCWYSNGSYYEGEFVNNIPHGVGKTVSSNGTTLCSGTYLYGLFIKASE